MKMINILGNMCLIALIKDNVVAMLNTIYSVSVEEINAITTVNEMPFKNDNYKKPIK